MLLYLSLEEELGPCPKTALIFPGCSFLVSAFTPLPDSQLFEPALWNREGHWRFLPTNTKLGAKRLRCPGAPEHPSWFHQGGRFPLTNQFPSTHVDRQWGHHQVWEEEMSRESSQSKSPGNLRDILSQIMFEELSSVLKVRSITFG